MRIGIVTATYLPSRNGVATSTALFVRGLRALGHEVRVFAPEHPRRDRTREEGVWRLPTTSIGAPDDYPLLLWPSVAVTARLPLADLDVLHTMHPFLSGQLALRWARRTGVPLVFTAHTQYHEYLHYTRLPRRLSRRLLKRHVSAFAAASDAVLAPGAAMEEMLRRYGYRGAVTRLPNPVDLGAFG
ncbi:glycosyltransferase, partial [Deinococcus pimensis]|uniref:glycosyltransferase n=1 Tax=Deinococcus pimensis TaxID=309888 RepID=UPI0012FB947B